MTQKNQTSYDARINRKYLYADFSDFSEITDETREKNASRVFTVGVRINNSMYRTNKESDEYIKKSLLRRLP